MRGLQSLVFAGPEELARCAEAVLADADVVVERAVNRLDPHYDPARSCGYRSAPARPHSRTAAQPHSRSRATPPPGRSGSRGRLGHEPVRPGHEPARPGQGPCTCPKQGRPAS